MPVREVLPRDHTHLSPAFSPTHAPPVARRASAPASPRFITFPPSPTGCAAWPNGYLSEKRLVAAKPRPIFGDADRLYEATADAKLTCARGGVAMVGAGRGCTVCDSVQAIEPPRLVAASWWLGDAHRALRVPSYPAHPMLLLSSGSLFPPCFCSRRHNRESPLHSASQRLFKETVPEIACSMGVGTWASVVGWGAEAGHRGVNPGTRGRG